MIEFANERKSTLGVNNVEFVLGDVTQVLKQYKDNSFDAATIGMAIHEMPRNYRLPMLQELARVTHLVLSIHV